MRTKMIRGPLATFLATLLFGTGTTAFAQSADQLPWPSRVIDTHRVGEVSPIVTGIALRPGLSEAIVVGDDHTLHLVDLNNGRLIQTLPGQEDWIRTIAFSPKGDALFTAGSDRRILKWDLEAQRWGIFATNNASIESIACSPDGNLVAAVGFESKLRIYDGRTGRSLSVLDCPCSDLRAVAFSADGTKLAAGGRSGQLLVWENRNGNWTSISQDSVHHQRIHGISFVGSDRIVSISEDRTVHVADLSSAANSGTVATMPSKLFSLAIISPNLIACGSSDNRIHLIDLQEKKAIGYLEGHQGTISSLAFAEDRLVSGSYDGETRVWQAESGIAVASNDPHRSGSEPSVSFDLPALGVSTTIERSASQPNASPPLLPIRSIR